MQHSIETYLKYDLLSDTTWKDPSRNNDEYHKSVKKDSKRLADLSYKFFKQYLKDV